MSFTSVLLLEKALHKLLPCAILSVFSKKVVSSKQKDLDPHIVLVDVRIVKPILEFSDLEMSFTSFNETKIFSTKNVSQDHVHVMFRCKDTQPSFLFELDQGMFETIIMY